MAADTTAEQATLQALAREYLASLKTAAAREAAQPEILKFVRWAGPDKDLSVMRAHEVAQYAENFPPTVSDAAKRADFVRAFLKWAKDQGVTAENLGIHLRVRKASKSSANAQTIVDPPIYLTQEGHDALVEELEQLKARRPLIQQDLARAMADKDFRENAPLDAMRDHQAMLEGRIREIEAVLRHAVIARTPTGDHRAQIGSTVVVRNLDSGRDLRYTLVSPSEVNPVEGKISFASPVGKALMERAPGDEVEVAAPAGTLRLRVERVEA